MNPTMQRISIKRAAGTVLLVEDDEAVARGLARVLMAEGYVVDIAANSAEAIDASMKGTFDVVISDLNLPGGSGVDVLSVIRAYEPDVPLVAMSGSPSIESAIEAVNLGALEFLVKPIGRDKLLAVVERALEKRRAAVAAGARTVQTTLKVPSGIGASDANATIPPRSALAAKHDDEPTIEVGAAPPPPLPVDAALDRALASLAVALDPVYDARHRSVVAYHARMSSCEETLATESAIVAAAEDAGRLCLVRRRARDLAAKSFADLAPGTKLFVDVYPADLLDNDLFSPEAPLSRIAESVVLQLRGGEASQPASDLAARVAVLRFLGFRIAIADLDAAPSTLSLVAELGPDFVKLDASLVRGIDASPPRQKVVAGLASMIGALGATVIAEGVATAEERTTLVHAGCYLAQGPINARLAGPVSARRPPASGIVANAQRRIASGE